MKRIGVALVVAILALLLWTRQSAKAPSPLSPASASASEPPAGPPPRFSFVTPPSTRQLVLLLRVRALLDAHPGAAHLTEVSCAARSCRVELETPSLDTVAEAFEHLQDPGSGLVVEGGRMQLENPVPLADDPNGPQRLAFTLHPDDGNE
jgi:hypothetical protein